MCYKQTAIDDKTAYTVDQIVIVKTKEQQHVLFWK